MRELRHNWITGQWVIISTDRAKRPEDFKIVRSLPAAPPHDPGCPFCPGCEAACAEEIQRVPAAGAWQVRAVKNKFPALGEGAGPNGGSARNPTRYLRSQPGIGRHEVIIETPIHNRWTAQLSVAELATFLELARQRMREIYHDPAVEHVILFKNQGEAAGSSLIHPHAQIVGMPVVPGQLRERIEKALQHYGDSSECLFCRCLNEERSAGVRIIAENEAYTAFIPFAALSPYHLWIFPRRHLAYFGALTDSQVASLAEILKDVLARLYLGLENPDFNYVVHSLSPSEAEVKYFHWYLSIVPRVSKSAGFELGTGMFINPAVPEESARFLRNLTVPPAL